MKFGIVDLLLIALFLLFMVRGAKRGLIRELSSLIGLILAIEMAKIYYPLVASSLTNRLALPPSVLSAVAFLLTFLLFYVIALLAGFLLHLLVAKGATGVIDKILGSLFSLTKIVVLTALTVFLLQNFGPSRNFSKQLVRSSPLLSIINNRIASPTAGNWLKKSIKRIKNDVLHN